MTSVAGLLGVIILARHGDRLGFFQDPLTYTASSTSITPLGNVGHDPHLSAKGLLNIIK